MEYKKKGQKKKLEKKASKSLLPPSYSSFKTTTNERTSCSHDHDNPWKCPLNCPDIDDEVGKDPSHQNEVQTQSFAFDISDKGNAESGSLRGVILSSLDT